jgi:hypothetical protein
LEHDLVICIVDQTERSVLQTRGFIPPQRLTMGNRAVNMFQRSGQPEGLESDETSNALPNESRGRIAGKAQILEGGGANNGVVQLRKGMSEVHSL